MQYQFRPITMWPGLQTPTRQRGRFKASYSDTLSLLAHELGQLRASNVVIEADVDESQIRRDGMLRSDARLNGPGIILSFGSKYGPLRYPCDTYTHWGDNLRAIALSLQALRAVDRYGVTRRAEQYTGWKALPPPAATGREELAPLDAAQWMLAKYEELGGGRVCHRETLTTNAELRGRVYRELAKRLHPDATGGPDLDFKQLTRAMRALESNHV